MFEYTKQFFSAPVLEDNEDTIRALRTLNAVSISLLAFLGVMFFGTIFIYVKKTAMTMTMLIIVAVLLVSRTLALRDRISFASVVLVSGLWCLVTVTIWLSGGFNTVHSCGYIVLTVIAGMLLGPRAALAVAAVSAITGLGFAALPILGFNLASYYPTPPLAALINLLCYFCLTVPAIWLALKGFNDALNAARQEAKDRKRSEEALRESEEKYRTLFEESKDAVIMTTRDGVVEDANQAFLDLFGFTREELPGMNILKIYVDHEDRRRFQQDIERDGAVKDYPVRRRKKNGTVIDCLLTSTVRKDKNGKVLGYRGIVRDVTEQKKLQSQLIQAQKMEAVGTLAGGIAHDFNNLLQAILGYTEILLMKKEPDDPDRKKLEVIQNAARDGADLVSRILAFSKKSESKVRPIDLNQELRRIEKLLRRTLPQMIRIDLVLSDELRVIDADPAQIEQVLLNLGVNAQHAMPDEGQLLIETCNVSISDEYLRTHLEAREGKYVLLTVSDTGIGMEPELLERIFEPFFTTKINGQGTGLGLSMVLGIVKQHGGYIRCYSGPGRGTSFKIYFPVSKTEDTWSLVDTREMPAFGTETILVVDDDDRVRYMAEQMIKMGGYQVLTARTGEDALEVYAGHREEIALVILDLIMPGMGGKRCLEGLLQIDPDARVIIASGLSSNGLAPDEKETGARGFVMKPYDAKDILRAIRKVLDQGHL